MKGMTESWLKQARAEGRITNELAVKMPPAPKVERVKPVFPIVIDCPGLIIVSEANQRCHWTERRNRAGGQKNSLLLGILLGRHARPLIEKPVRITFTRIGGRKLDSDNLANGFKAVRDALCGWIGIDDGDDTRLTFVYGQEKGVKGIRCVIEEL